MAEASTATKTKAKSTAKKAVEEVIEKTEDVAEATERIVEYAAENVVETKLVQKLLDKKAPIAIIVGTGLVSGAVLYVIRKRKQRSYGTHEVPVFTHDPARVIGRVETVVEVEDGIEVKGHVMDAEMYEQIVQNPIVVEDEPRVIDGELGLAEVSLTMNGPGEILSVEPVVEEVFARNDSTWDYDQEIEGRAKHPLEPHVIHQDEFFEQDNDYSQTQWTWYEGDSIMADEQGSTVYNWANLIGELKFGHGSGGDPNLFYVRNNQRQAEYEITKHAGMYAVEVEGLDPDDLQQGNRLQHSRFPLRDE